MCVYPVFHWGKIFKKNIVRNDGSAKKKKKIQGGGVSHIGVEMSTESS